MNLKDKVAVVTGASDGIGKQIALKLAERGVNLALIARSKEGLNRTKQEAEKLGAGKTKIYSCDIRSNKELKKTVKLIASNFNGIDILINDAGIWQKLSPLEEIKEDIVEDVIKTNLTALIQCTRLVLPYLKRRKEAAIINISSKSGVTAQEGQSVYSASKWGVHGFTEVLKTDLKNSNIRVAGVYQSGTNTKMFAKAGEKLSTEKFTEPSDLAEVVVYILSHPEKLWIHEVHVEY